MISLCRLVAILVVASASVASAQTPLPASSDTAAGEANAVMAYAIRSGRLMLSNKANPKPVSLPDGVYRNQSGVVLAILDGRVTRIGESTGELTEIASMRLNKDRLVKLTPSTNALMTVADVTLPSGTFTSEDGRSSVKIIFGRPTEFTIPGRE